MTRLQSVRLHWWLGRRLLRAPGQRWALAALALTSTLSALLILGLTAAPNVLDDQQASEAARTVTETGKRTGVTAYASIWDWRDEHSIYLLRIGVEAENFADAAHLPGVPRPPMLDEIWLSPQLAQDLARDPVLRRAFPQHVVGAIDESVLPTSQDRVAYIGVDPKALTQRGIRATQSIGTEPSEGQTSSRMLVLLGGATLALFVVVPLAAVSIAAFGLLAQPRQRQLRLLEALGATPRRARVLVSADGIVAGLLGTAVAWLLFETLSRAVTHVPFTPARWTAGQPDIQVTGALLSLLAPLAAATWAAWRLKDRTTPDQVRPRRAAGRHPSIVPLPLLFAAIALVAVLATSGVRADSSPLASAAVAAAVSLSALSAPAAITWGQQAIGLALLRSARLSAPQRDGACRWRQTRASETKGLPHGQHARTGLRPGPRSRSPDCTSCSTRHGDRGTKPARRPSCRVHVTRSRQRYTRTNPQLAGCPRGLRTQHWEAVALPIRLPGFQEASGPGDVLHRSVSDADGAVAGGFRGVPLSWRLDLPGY